MESTYGKDKDTLLGTDLTPAAVLIPLLAELSANATRSPSRVQLKARSGLIELPISTQVLLTQRTHTVEHHKGQISFPGGGFEPQDRSLEETALRETFEEIGLQRSHIEVVAELPEIPTVGSGFRVQPYVGVVRGTPEFVPNPHEIGEILLVPLEHLLDPRNSVMETHERNGMRYQIRAYHYQGHRIWGATGLMLQHFLERYLVS